MGKHIGFKSSKNPYIEHYNLKTTKNRRSIVPLNTTDQHIPPGPKLQLPNSKIRRKNMLNVLNINRIKGNQFLNNHVNHSHGESTIQPQSQHLPQQQMQNKPRSMILGYL